MMQSHLVIEKLRRNLKAKGFEKLTELFPDSEGSNTTNIIEFKNVLKKVGINTKEVDRLMEILVVSGNGFLDLEVLNKKLLKLE